MTVTIRADRYEPLQTAPELAGIQSEVFDELKPMPPAGYTEVITGPARRATAAGRPLSIQPALVERLLADGAQGADALPLLALTLQQLYHDFGADGELSVADYEAMGGMPRWCRPRPAARGCPSGGGRGLPDIGYHREHGAPVGPSRYTAPGWCEAAELASNLSAGYQPSVSEPVAQRLLAGPVGPA